MATKIKLMTMLQEMRGYAQITNRVPQPRPSVLYLMKLRAKNAAANSAKRRLSISVTGSHGGNIPLPIKINHVKPDAESVRVFAR